MFNWIKHFKNKELFIALYFLIFIFGISLGISGSFYNELRVLEFLLVFSFSISSVFYNHTLNYKDYLLLFFILVGMIFWENSEYIFYESLLLFLLYKSFLFLKYNENYTKIIIFLSFFIFIMFPFSVYQYLVTGEHINWYPLPWNIRVYDSYFLIFLILSTWFILKEEKLNWIYLIFNYLALLAILLDGGRSVLLAYTIFTLCILIFNAEARKKIALVYTLSWLSFLVIVSYVGAVHPGLNIARLTTSLRYDLWNHAYKCWIEHPLFGCGFYQLGQYEEFAAHPHNFFIQVLTETGIIGFSFLTIILISIYKKINWNIKENYFLIASLSAIFIDMCFSGIHIYPITQVSILWLFLFLFKSKESLDINSFNKGMNFKSLISLLVYMIVFYLFIYLFINTSALYKNLALTPPRFWEYGYLIF